MLSSGGNNVRFGPFYAETFSPWGPDSYEADTFEVRSDVYSGEELLERFGLKDR